MDIQWDVDVSAAAEEATQGGRQVGLGFRQISHMSNSCRAVWPRPQHTLCVNDSTLFSFIRILHTQRGCHHKPSKAGNDQL